MRNEAVAGSFYPEDRKALNSFIENSLKEAKVDANAVKSAYAFVAPHAGYIYSGKTAAYTYKAISLNSRLNEIETVIVIGPNHTGFGRAISVSLDDWRTPIEIARNDRAFSKALADASGSISIDESAHRLEHSVEVQLPFVQSVLPNRKFTFVCMGDQGLDYSRALSEAILKAEAETSRKIAVIASSDFDHYESAEIARKKDTKLLNAISRLDSASFNKLIDELNDSACGYGPITVAMLYALGKGAGRGVLLDYSNSGDAMGDYSSVVAYASLAFV